MPIRKARVAYGTHDQIEARDREVDDFVALPNLHRGDSRITRHKCRRVSNLDERA